MGWLFYAPSRRALIEDRIRSYEGPSIIYEGTIKQETLRWCTKGNNLWMVKQTTYPNRAPTRWIELDLMANSVHGWGYKDMDESCGPYHVNCPLSYLDDLTEPINDYSREWRENVRKYHALEQAKRDRARALAAGDTVTIYGKAYTVLAVQPRGKLRVRSHENGVVYSARASQLTLADA